MRALPARLPLRYTPSNGMVVQILDSAAATGLLEGDALVSIGGAPAVPPREWPAWPLYERLLDSGPGDELEVEAVRPGTGRVTGKVRLLPPLAPHLSVADSIDVRAMPYVTEIARDGRLLWTMDTASDWRTDEVFTYRVRGGSHPKR